MTISQLATASRLMTEGASDTRIATHLGVTRHAARTLMQEVERQSFGALQKGKPATAISYYDAARNALSIARTLDEVKDLSDRAAVFREIARRAKSRDLEMDAVELRVRAERRMGEMMVVGKSAGDLKKSSGPRKQKIGSDSEPIKEEAYLSEIGVDKKLAMHAQKLAKIPEKEFETRAAAWREESEHSQDRISLSILRQTAVTGSRATMASRVHKDDGRDFFPTPPWATRALMERVMPRLQIHDFRTAEEPACGEGHISEVLTEYFDEVRASDAFDYGGNMIRDFLNDDFDVEQNDDVRPDWIITNPPFGEKVTQFIERALDQARIGVAMFLQLRYLEGLDRYERIFKPFPPTLCSFFAERVPLHKGQWDPKGDTATAYCWLVWIIGEQPHPPFWIPPGCREALTHEDDVERFTQHPVRKP